jgi:hypothetical protein
VFSFYTIFIPSGLKFLSWKLHKLASSGRSSWSVTIYETTRRYVQENSNLPNSVSCTVHRDNTQKLLCGTLPHATQLRQLRCLFRTQHRPDAPPTRCVVHSEDQLVLLALPHATQLRQLRCLFRTQHRPDAPPTRCVVHSEDQLVDIHSDSLESRGNKFPFQNTMKHASSSTHSLLVCPHQRSVPQVVLPQDPVAGQWPYRF